MTAERTSQTVRAIWAACLVGAGFNHLRILLQRGLTYDYGGAGLLSSIYWTSLTVIDPLVAALLFLRPRLSIVATMILIVTNVFHNTLMTARFHGWTGWPDLAEQVFTAPTTAMQVGFLLFVLATAHVAWRGLPALSRAPCVNAAKPS